MLQLADRPEKILRRNTDLQLEATKRRRRKAEQRSLIHFLKRLWPWFIVEEVHLLMAGYIESLVFGLIDRYMQFLAPRAGKSLMGSVITPIFYIGNFPGDKVMQ